ncbi:hypothetical protein BDW02DRAFT_581512 [Decorospora gaudefroyi]|uniref:Uncharacterized protein n=1 Tax=Decorospora gaudefroyi TaxID=184978 RepID=A0A6A5KBC3_9PLEO|nr:hypothetical protein BDW02DRAFT_581512 [Decorospora gaudefroyi]
MSNFTAAPSGSSRWPLLPYLPPALVPTNSAPQPIEVLEKTPTAFFAFPMVILTASEPRIPITITTLAQLGVLLVKYRASPSYGNTALSTPLDTTKRLDPIFAGRVLTDTLRDLEGLLLAICRLVNVKPELESVEGAFDETATVTASNMNRRIWNVASPVVFLNGQRASVHATATNSRYSPDCAITIMYSITERLKLAGQSKDIVRDLGKAADVDQPAQ